ncbi:MAG: DnaA/Hda family protein, partial [Gammaproteobacteria bacterium]|nr:DnaA/Hda family protein [Gammaproteobacteria bacterium]
MQESVWSRCIERLEGELSAQQFNKLVRPLHAVEEGSTLKLFAPNRFIVDSVSEQLLDYISEVIRDESEEPGQRVVLEVARRAEHQFSAPQTFTPPRPDRPIFGGRLNPEFTFERFVEGKSNQLARAAARQIADNPGVAYNPLFIYGGTGLGKTHLMHAVGNQMIADGKGAGVAYVHSERFVGDMVKALRRNTINEFKRAYRSLDALLIDDIQFFAGKERSQEEFFHTFNALLEGQ